MNDKSRYKRSPRFHREQISPQPPTTSMIYQLELVPNYSTNHYDIKVCKLALFSFDHHEHVKCMQLLCCLTYTPNNSTDTFKAPKDSPTNAYHPNNCNKSTKKLYVIQKQASKIYNISPTIQKEIHQLLLDTAFNILKNRHPAGPGHERCFFEISVSWCSGIQGWQLC